MQMMKNIAKLVLDNYFYHLLQLLEITLKSIISREKKRVVTGSKCNQPYLVGTF